jgi:cardiolipin synthase
VRLLLHGRYENFMQYHAARPLYGALLQAGVEIYEYHGGLLHAKVAVVDGHWATVGSSNLDPLSLQLAREANVVLEDVTLAKMLQLQLEQAMAEHGKPLDAQTFVRRPWWQRQQDWVAYAVMRIILFLMGRRY